MDVLAVAWNATRDFNPPPWAQDAAQGTVFRRAARDARGADATPFLVATLRRQQVSGDLPQIVAYAVGGSGVFAAGLRLWEATGVAVDWARSVRPGQQLYLHELPDDVLRSLNTILGLLLRQSGLDKKGRARLQTGHGQISALLEHRARPISLRRRLDFVPATRLAEMAQTEELRDECFGSDLSTWLLQPTLPPTQLVHSELLALEPPRCNESIVSSSRHRFVNQ